jgi:hypothetical protein
LGVEEKDTAARLGRQLGDTATHSACANNADL